MNAQARARYPEILEADWETLGYNEPPDFRVVKPDLEEEIHPIFQYNIPGRLESDPIWPLFSQQEYQNHLVDLDPVFRLATKIMLSPRSLDFFYWLIYTPRMDAEPPISNLGEPVFQYRCDDMPEEIRHEYSKAALHRLARTHQMMIYELVDNGLTKGRFSLSKDEEGINIIDDSTVPSGVKSWIKLNRKYLDELARLRLGGSVNYHRISRLQLKMAMTSIHEVAVSTPNMMRLHLGISTRIAEHIIHASYPSCYLVTLFGSHLTIRKDADIEAFQHATNNARDRTYLENGRKERALQREAKLNGVDREQQVPINNEDLFEDESCAETGYSWEAWVFGGTVGLDDLDPSYPLLLTKWPNFLHSTTYLRRRGWKASMTRYLVPMHYVLNLNQQRFWNEVDGDTTALFIKKVVGIRKPCPESDIDPDWNASDSSEGKYPTDRQRFRGLSDSFRVTRIRQGLPIVDPSHSRANESEQERLDRDTKDYLDRLAREQTS